MKKDDWHIKNWWGCLADKKEIKSGNITKIYKLEEIEDKKVVEIFEFAKTIKQKSSFGTHSSYSKQYCLADIIDKKDFDFKSLDNILHYIDNYTANIKGRIILDENTYIRNCQYLLQAIRKACEGKMHNKCLLEDGTAIMSSEAKFASEIYSLTKRYIIK